MHSHHDLEPFLRQLSHERGWPYTVGNGEYLIEVATTQGRSQVVHLMPGSDPDGLPLVYIWSPVGPAQLAQRDPLWFLRYNTELSYGACAIYGDLLVVKASQLLTTADPEELLRLIFYVGRTADTLEAELQGMGFDRA